MDKEKAFPAPGNALKIKPRVNWELDPIQLLKAVLPGRGAGYGPMMVMMDRRQN
ncbi:MAG TPA: hypothetical protein VFZ76_15945 [Anaerolineales bacterium]